jgi:hypothetical protein
VRDLWLIVEALRAKKNMVRFSSFPGGTVNLAVYDSEKQSQQYMYDAHSFDELETLVKKHWGHLLGPVGVTKPLPLPPGFPRP